MKKQILSVALAAMMTFTCIPAMNVPAAASTNGVPMYRMYNYHSGEHFYTQNADERNSLLVKGWDYEGVGWTAPEKGASVYRLYNPNAGDHHYTTSKVERDMLRKLGWKYEGIGWKSDTSRAVPLYRAYNPNAKSGTHNYTTSKGENDYLVKLGWIPEGISWYGTKAPAKGTTNVPDGAYFVEMTTGELADSSYKPVGNVKNLSVKNRLMTFSGQVYQTTNTKMQPYGKDGRKYRFEFSDDCLFYIQPTDVAPRDLLTQAEFNKEAMQDWKDARGGGGSFAYLNVQNGYVTYAYFTW